MGHSNETRLKLFTEIILKLVNFGYLQTLYFWQVYLLVLSSREYKDNIKPLLITCFASSIAEFFTCYIFTC